MAAIARLHLLRPAPSAVSTSLLYFNLHRPSAFSNPNYILHNTRIRKLSFTRPLCSNSDSILEGSSNSGSSASIVGDLLDYLNESWTQFHATARWPVLIYKEYVLFGCLCRWRKLCRYRGGNGFHVIAAHTDSPCLKLKPKSASSKSGYLMLNVQTYGGGLWHTWFDRDLSLAGRVIVREKDGSFSHKLIKLKRPILRVPTLAIHLDRSPVLYIFAHMANGDYAFKYNVQYIKVILLVSADMAHGVHPNFIDKHEEHHRPELQKGLVIKHNANQRTVLSSLRPLPLYSFIPVLEFVVRNDMGCGSTIGPILASGVGIRTVDCGIAQLSMHRYYLALLHMYSFNNLRVV
ncbi:hypothetical protein Vadar_001780 [Vaccinium darrowii]|nr:hypothetical protein Vadar_001780 [Vaccinium darrowii]